MGFLDLIKQNDGIRLRHTFSLGGWPPLISLVSQSCLSTVLLILRHIYWIAFLRTRASDSDARFGSSDFCDSVTEQERTNRALADRFKPAAPADRLRNSGVFRCPAHHSCRIDSSFKSLSTPPLQLSDQILVQSDTISAIHCHRPPASVNFSFCHLSRIFYLFSFYVSFMSPPFLASPDGVFLLAFRLLNILFEDFNLFSSVCQAVGPQRRCLVGQSPYRRNDR